jgi:hypothetical protein
MKKCILLCCFLASADAFVNPGVGVFRSFTQSSHQRNLCSFVNNVCWRSKESTGHRHPRVYMGRFDMEPPYNPPGHLCYEKVDVAIRPSLTEFIASETKDPSIALLFSSISSGIKSIAGLTRYVELMHFNVRQ